MKKILLSFLIVTATIFANAQENNLVPDQNPDFKVSLDKYKGQQDKLMATMNTTVQDTYKAYDWYEAKQERKQQRVADRRERRLYELQNYGNFYNPYNRSYDPFFIPYRYAPFYYGHRGWRHW